MIRIPSNQLSDTALLGVIDDYVLREGTDYGATEDSLESKRARVRQQLAAGTAVIWFDPPTGTVTLRRVDDDPTD